MAKKEPEAATLREPMLSVHEWMRRQSGLPRESMAGFMRQYADDAWATATQWADRWSAWLRRVV